MLYVVSTSKDMDDSIRYRLLETGTESIFSVTEHVLKKLKLVHGLDIKNIVFKIPKKGSENWWNNIKCEKSATNSGAEYTLLCEVGKDTFKIISEDEFISYISFEQLRVYTEQSRLTNCYMHNDKLVPINTYTTTKDNQLEQTVDTQYKRYEVLSTMLGSKMSFEYIVECNDVRLVKYTGISKNVIVPKFITAIKKNAFHRTSIETITLEPGLKSIGSHAFDECDLAEITVPETVDFVGTWAIDHNKKLRTQEREFKKEKIIILNGKAAVLDRYNYTNSY